MKAVVFGGDGYIGRHLKNLTRMFDEIVLVDNRRPRHDVLLADVRSRFRHSLPARRRRTGSSSSPRCTANRDTSLASTSRRI